MRSPKPNPSWLRRRSAGILLHLTSLPGKHGTGDLGSEAHAFVDFLARAGQTWWQMLPVQPPGEGHSPYSARSAFAGSPLLIALAPLVEQGLLPRDDLEASIPGQRLDAAAATRYRMPRLQRAWRTFVERPAKDRAAFEAFVAAEAGWIEDFATFQAVHDAERKPWWEWAPALRLRAPDAMRSARAALSDEIGFVQFQQYLFDQQWSALRAHCAAKGVGLIGDLPFFVAHDSADVWAHPELFLLDDAGRPTHMAGVPPDYFSATGQLWGNPLFRWKTLERQGHGWWMERIGRALGLFDLVRLDHFIGFTRAWAVPAGAETAERGEFTPGPGEGFFLRALEVFGSLPFIAEDLGTVTPEVRRLRDHFRMPGMRVLQFAFGEGDDGSIFLPHNYPRRSVAYTGTHDNDTMLGWFDDLGGPGRRSPEQASAERRAAVRYVVGPGAERLPESRPWPFIRSLYASASRIAILPMQDVLGLGSEARMNTPGMATGSWEWRLAPSVLTDALAARLLEHSATYGRRPAPRSAATEGS